MSRHGQSRNSCSDNRELISAFLDGEVSQDERARLRAHLATCADCRADLDSYRQIGTSIRALPPVQSPEHLTDAIFGATIDAEPRRLFLITSRLGYSVAAVAAVVLIFIAAAYLLIGGYQRGITPSIKETAPQEAAMWPIHQPVQITFNKEMDRESVLAALGIFPSGEDDRLNLSWQGNTLIIGANQTLKPETAYSIKITTDARDKWGKRLGSEFQLSFATSPTVATVETPTPAPTVPAPQPTATRGDTVVGTPTATNARVTPSVPAVATARPSHATATPGTGAIGGTNTTPVVNPTPTPTPSDDLEPNTPVTEPTPTPIELPPTPSPAATATASVPTPTATLEPSPTQTATEAPPTPTSASIPVTGAFGDVYWGNEWVRQNLGAPQGSALATTALLLDFQRGEMLYREDIGLIYVLVAPPSGLWSSLYDTADSYPAAEQVDGTTDLWRPGGVIGALWRAETSIQDDLGYATSETARTSNAATQTFEGGVMFATPSLVYVLYDDGSWEFYPTQS